MTRAVQTQRLAADRQGIAQAADILRDGGLVAFPTETVYGLGGDATNPAAVAGIFGAKDRPSFNPLIVHVPDVGAARALINFSNHAEKLAETFWPGPLTLVAPMRAGTKIADLVTAGLPTLAVRVPAHPVARSLLEILDRPVAAPSANPSGRISPTSAAHVLDGLDGRIDAVLDAGPCAVGLESTIIGLADETPQLLRPGGIPIERIEEVLGTGLEKAGPDINAPGQLASHYAPNAPLRMEAQSPAPGEVFLGFGPGDADLNLSRSGDLAEAAAHLFGHLRALDIMAAGRRIAVAPIPEHGLGLAINDRLRRAAAPR